MDFFKFSTSKFLLFVDKKYNEEPILPPPSPGA